MRRILMWLLIGALAIFFCITYWLHGSNQTSADFLIRWVLSIGTISAVLFALYGDYLREKIDPIHVRIDVPEERNTVFDRCEINGKVFDVYCHPLRVRNLTPHKPIKESRVCFLCNRRQLPARGGILL